jgi:tellurite resistance protein
VLFRSHSNYSFVGDGVFAQAVIAAGVELAMNEYGVDEETKERQEFLTRVTAALAATDLRDPPAIAADAAFDAAFKKERK